jgi:tetratricopeptide (TPR) repeat protein
VDVSGSPLPTDVRSRSVGTWVWVAGIAIVALALRLMYLAELSGTPLFSVVLGDGLEYDRWAQQIAAGQWMGSEVFYQTPLYPYVLAVVYRLAGHDLMLVRVLQAVLGAVSCVLLALAGRRFLTERAGVIAAMLLAVYPVAIFFDGLIQKSALDLFLTTLTLALLGEFLFRLRWTWLAAGGVAIGLLMLNRENARVLYPIVGAWLLLYFRDTPIRKRVAWLAVFTAAVAAVLLPVGLRNYRVGGEFLISTSQLGPNFYIGNRAGALGTYQPLVPDRGHVSFERADATRLAEEATGRKLSPGEVSDYWLERALSEIRSRPLDWLLLLARKLQFSVSARELVDTESMEAYASYSKLLRGLSWFSFGVILPLAALGVWDTRRQWRQLGLLYAIILGMVLSIAIFYVMARYRYPIVPVVLLLAAAGVSAVPNIRRNWRSGAIPGLRVAGGVALVCFLPTPGVIDPTWQNLGSEFIRMGKPAEAVPLLERAIDASPEDPLAHFNLGVALNQLGQKQRAIDEFSSAVRLRPDYFDAHSSLALTLQEAGRIPAALRYFREAVRLRPGSSGARCNLGLALSAMGQSQEAIEEYMESLRLNPENAIAHNAFGVELQKAGRFQEAIDQHRAALRVKPDYAEAHGNLALVLHAAGEQRAAVEHLEQATRLQPDNFGIRMNAGFLLTRMGRNDEAIAQYEQAALLWPNSMDALYVLGQSYGRARRWQEAIGVLEKALAIARSQGRDEAAQQIEAAIRSCRAQLARRPR